MRSLLVRGLREEGYRAESVGPGTELIDRVARTAPPDLFIIDIGLPDADGRDVCQALRAQGIVVPVLFLTARDALPDRLSGFSAGGDDYLTKPFAFAELVARLAALLRRAGGEQSVQVGELRLDPAAHAAVCGGATVPLTPTEFRLLARLAAAPVKRSAGTPWCRPPGPTERSSTTTHSTPTSRACAASCPPCPELRR